MSFLPPSRDAGEPALPGIGFEGLEPEHNPPEEAKVRKAYQANKPLSLRVRTQLRRNTKGLQLEWS